jgi:NAD(P)-dependent dehydrogenase (short-subunit alcohol dehydrogenase family)
LFGASWARFFINSLECNAVVKFRKQARMEIDGKRVLVTGAGRGLGRAVVAAFVDAGAAQVIAGTRKREDREALQSERVTPVQLDVTSDAEIEAVARM